MDDEKIAVTVSRNTWEALCEASDEYSAASETSDLQEIRYLVERLIEESRGYQASPEGMMALRELNREAEENSITEMSPDEIEEEIAKARVGRKHKKDDNRISFNNL